jgi:hypothetical protein
MTLVSKHGSVAEARKAFQDALDEVPFRGPFMAALFTIGADGLVNVFRTSFDFPTNRFDAASSTLIKDLREEVAGINQLPAEPLPLAPGVRLPMTEGQKKQICREIRRTYGAQDHEQEPPLDPAAKAVEDPPLPEGTDAYDQEEII